MLENDYARVIANCFFIIGFQRKRYPSLDSHDYVI